MPITDITAIIRWEVMLVVLGWCFLPLSTRIWGSLFDRGYAFAKILAIMVVSYLTWLLANLHVLAFNQINVLGLSVILGVGQIVVLRHQGLGKLIKRNWPVFVGEELIFMTAVGLWSYVRGFQPDIQGLEKYMDFGFVNAILRSEYFPPLDMWFAGQTINYYYFGQLIAAVLTKISGLESSVSYNLMIATIFGLSVTGVFSLSGNLVYLSKQVKSRRKVLGAGIVAAVLVNLGGNLQPLWYWLKNHEFTNYWYPDATRFIVTLFGAADNTIHEFPIYSYVVADLHGHLSNLPMVLMGLALILTIYLEEKETWLRYGLMSLCLAVFYMTNTWDVPIYLLVLGLAVWRKTGNLIQAGARAGIVMVGATLLALPFILRFKNIAGGIGLADFHSPVWMLGVLWGFPVFTSLIFLGLYWRYKRDKVDDLVLILMGVAWLMVVMPEIIYVKDIYIHEYQRANTMFKLTYQAFILFGLSSSYSLIKMGRVVKNWWFKGGLMLVGAGLLFFIGSYPVFAIRSYYGLKTYRGLEGLSYLRDTGRNDDWQVITWLKQKPGAPVIVEAVGESYTDFGRISANTGLPTILGWRVHEWLWRGSFDEPGARTGEVQEIYNLTNPELARSYLRKYQVKYIIIGDLERQAYPQINEKGLEGLGKIVFQSSRAKIIELSR